MNERIKRVRKEANMTQEQFAKTLELSRNHIAQVETNKGTASDRTLKDICRIFNVNYQWLINGTGQMYKEDDSDAQAIIDSVMTGDNEFAKRTLVAFAKMSEEQWELIKKLIKEIEPD